MVKVICENLTPTQYSLYTYLKIFLIKINDKLKTNKQSKIVNRV